MNPSTVAALQIHPSMSQMAIKMYEGFGYSVYRRVLGERKAPTSRYGLFSLSIEPSTHPSSHPSPPPPTLIMKH
jgi:hypothetical protein